MSRYDALEKEPFALYSVSAYNNLRAIGNELSPPFGGLAAPYCPDTPFSLRSYRRSMIINNQTPTSPQYRDDFYFGGRSTSQAEELGCAALHGTPIFSRICICFRDFCAKTVIFTPVSISRRCTTIFELFRGCQNEQ